MPGCTARARSGWPLRRPTLGWSPSSTAPSTIAGTCPRALEGNARCSFAGRYRRCIRATRSVRSRTARCRGTSTNGTPADTASRRRRRDARPPTAPTASSSPGTFLVSERFARSARPSSMSRCGTTRATCFGQPRPCCSMWQAGSLWLGRSTQMLRTASITRCSLPEPLSVDGLSQVQRRLCSRGRPRSRLS